MTTSYDPGDPTYLDEASVRGELIRVNGVCDACRRCVDLCTAFPTLFEMLDAVDGRDAGLLTPAEQDRVVDECFQCKLCAVRCPYTPERHEWRIDVPRLMLRADAMRHTTGQQPIGRRRTTEVIARTAGLGRAASVVAPLANLIVAARPGSVIRRGVAKVTGVSGRRLLPPYARQRFSTWFAERTGQPDVERRRRVTIYPTCVVEYHDTQTGKDVVRVFERNGVECTVSTVGCCGAPWLHAGDLARFVEAAERNVAVLAEEVRTSGDLVVLQPTCGYVVARDYADYVRDPARRADAELVAARTRDAAAYLVDLDRAGELDREFVGEVPDRVIHHVACHQRAQGVDAASSDLVRLTGAEVELVEQCSGVDGLWGYRVENEELSIPFAERLGERIVEAGGGRAGTVVTGDCSLATTAIAEQTGVAPIHPIQLLARAYGIPPDD